MLGAILAFLKKNHITRFLCVLLLVFSCAFLTGCGDDEEEPADTEKNSQIETLSEGCWTCSLFTACFGAVEDASAAIVSRTAGSIVPFLAVFTGLWLALHILKFVSSLSEPDTKAFWKAIAVQCFWLAMGAALLRDLQSGADSSVVELIVKPIFSGFVDFGLLVVSGTSGEGQVSCPTGDPATGMVCLVKGVQDKLSLGFKIGLKGFLFASCSLKVAGLVLMIISVMMMVNIPLLLLDCAFRYGMILCLLPMFICAYCFSATRSLVGKGATCLVEIGMAVVGLCVFVSLAASILHEFTIQYAPSMTVASAVLASDPEKANGTMEGSEAMGLIFIMTFLHVFGKIVMDIMKKFGGLGGIGSMATKAKGYFKDCLKKSSQMLITLRYGDVRKKLMDKIQGSAGTIGDEGGDKGGDSGSGDGDGGSGGGDGGSGGGDGGSGGGDSGSGGKSSGGDA